MKTSALRVVSFPGLRTSNHIHRRLHEVFDRHPAISAERIEYRSGRSWLGRTDILHMHWLTDVYVVLSESQRSLIPTGGRERPLHVLGIPGTGELFPDSICEVSRADLDLPEGPLVAFVGRIHPYKRVPEFVAAFEAADSSGVTLVVVGENLDPTFSPTE